MTEIDKEEKTMRIRNEGTFPTLLCLEAFCRNATKQPTQKFAQRIGSAVINTGVYQVLYGEAPSV